MLVAQLPDDALQNPQVLMSHMQVLLQAMMLSQGDELVQAYRAVVEIFNAAQAGDATGTP